MKLYTVRLHRGQELRQALQAYAKEWKLQASSIVTCVAALESVTLRMAGAKPDHQTIRTYDQEFEVVSLVGTLTATDCHLHVAVSDKEGRVRGGHLKAGTVGVTAEVVIAEDEAAVYDRVLDPETGFEELEARSR